MSQIEINGEIEKITFRNEENGYTIAKLKPTNLSGAITVVGSLLSARPGENLLLKGQWHTHPKFGPQFKIASYESIIPSTIKGIENYLGSGLIKGIGPVMAKKLVTKFGINTLDILETATARLHEVNGLGKKKIELIQSAWKERREAREVMVFLQGHDVSPAYAAKIFKRYNKDSIRLVTENPYRLADDIFGIGFLIADKIAMKLGIPKDSAMRAEAGILYVLNQLAEKKGHVFYPYETLIAECETALEIGREAIVKAFGKIALAQKIVIENLQDSDIGRPEENNKAVYLSKLYSCETGIVKSLLTLRQYPKNLGSFNLERTLEQLQSELKIQLAERQKEAIKEAVKQKIMVITGGPGTGKTTIVNSIIKIYGYMGKSVLLAAPTGRAAKRMSEVTGHEAKTIHRLLEFNPKEGKFRKNEDNPMEADLIILDESSMVDTMLMHNFLKAVPKQATLIFVGDIDQLPSVGAGRVLKDIISSGVITTVRLTEIFRQAEESRIIVNAHKVNRGQMPVIDTPAGVKRDFHFIEIEDPEEALKEIITLCKERIPQIGFDAINDIQVLTPMHKGVIGTQALNLALQTHLNPSTDALNNMGRVLKTGDKVMQIRNNYNKDVFNGDLGRIAVIDRETQEVFIDFNDKRVPYDYNELDEITHAYAISIHKSQGSEYPVVVIPIMTQHYIMLQRNLLYTAITRGKELVILVGTEKAVGIAVKNNATQKRYTLLQDRLKNPHIFQALATGYSQYQARHDQKMSFAAKQVQNSQKEAELMFGTKSFQPGRLFF